MKTPIVVVLSLILSFADSFCDFDVKLEQYLNNEGFHRNLSYKMVFNEELFNEVQEECIVGLDQALPPGVFVNPDELSELRRWRKLSAFPRSRVNIELPADQSDPLNVFIMAKMTRNEAGVWLPVHARYHPALANGGFAENTIDPPRVFLRCPDRRLDHCGQQASGMTFLCNGSSKDKCSWREVPVSVYTEELVFKVPVGNESDYHLVGSVTISVVIAGSLYLLKTLHEYKLMGHKKRN